MTGQSSKGRQRREEKENTGKKEYDNKVKVGN